MTSGEAEAAVPTRDALFAMLGDPMRAREAVDAIRANEGWTKGTPPSAVLAALAHVDYDAEGPVFELARAWDRHSMCTALIETLEAERDPKLREHDAWLLKHLALPSAWEPIAALAQDEKESVGVRRWLIEGLDRLVAARAIGWHEVGELVTKLARHADATIRDGTIGILMSLEKSDDKRRVLLDILRHDDDEVVIASAVHALAGSLPVEIDQAIVDRLLAHPSERVQSSIKDLVERAQRQRGN
jgi:hypothetical protein